VYRTLTDECEFPGSIPGVTISFHTSKVRYDSTEVLGLDWRQSPQAESTGTLSFIFFKPHEVD